MFGETSLWIYPEYVQGWDARRLGYQQWQCPYRMNDNNEDGVDRSLAWYMGWENCNKALETLEEKDDEFIKSGREAPEPPQPQPVRRWDPAKGKNMHIESMLRRLKSGDPKFRVLCP